MNSTLQKISINDLQPGMFVVEMDITWMKSPFLFHRREIKSLNDVILLKKSGVKILTIDLAKSHLNVENNHLSVKNKLVIEPESTSDFNEIKPGKAITINPELITRPNVPLNNELEQAILLKERALESFKEFNLQVMNNDPLSTIKFEQLIDETVSSLLRNSQALLTLVHLKRDKEILFSHLFSVMTLALTFAITQGVSRENLKILGLAALLHDIGWSQLSLNLFGQIKKYSKNELKVVYQHLENAAIIITNCQHIPDTVKHIINNHHERIDGSGYPKGLKGKQLDPLSKILILSDFYDELVHGLIDQPGLIPSESLRFLYQEATQNKLDKFQVEQLIKLLGIYPLTSAIELSTGEQGVVIEIHHDKPLKPMVKIIYSSTGHVLKNPLIIDLETDKKQRQIIKVLDLSDDKTDPLKLLTVKGVI